MDAFYNDMDTVKHVQSVGETKHFTDGGRTTMKWIKAFDYKMLPREFFFEDPSHPNMEATIQFSLITLCAAPTTARGLSL